MSGFNRITKERYLEIKEEAIKDALEHIDTEEKAILVDEKKKDFTSEDERIVYIGNLYFPDDDEFLKDYNMYSRNIKLMADNYNLDTYIVRCKVLEMAMFKDAKPSSSETIITPFVQSVPKENNVIEENTEVEEKITKEEPIDQAPYVYENPIENNVSVEEQNTIETISDFDDMTDSFLNESSAKVNEISEKNVEIETLQKSLIESIRVAKVNVSRKSEELNSKIDLLEKERREFEEYKRIEIESLANERTRLEDEEKRLLALKNKIMDTIKTFEDAKASLANVFNNQN